MTCSTSTRTSTTFVRTGSRCSRSTGSTTSSRTRATRCRTCLRPSRTGSSCTRTRWRSSTCGQRRPRTPDSPDYPGSGGQVGHLRPDYPGPRSGLEQLPDLEVGRVVGGRAEHRRRRRLQVDRPDDIADGVGPVELLDVLLAGEPLERGLRLVDGVECLVVVADVHRV